MPKPNVVLRTVPVDDPARDGLAHDRADDAMRRKQAAHVVANRLAPRVWT